MLDYEKSFNIFPYHEVLASLLAQIFNLVTNKQYKQAEELIIQGYITAAALNGVPFEECTRKVKNKNIYELLYLMVQEQKKAGIAPLQFGQRNIFFQKALSKVLNDEV